MKAIISFVKTITLFVIGVSHGDLCVGAGNQTGEATPTQLAFQDLELTDVQT